MGRLALDFKVSPIEATRAMPPVRARGIRDASVESRRDERRDRSIQALFVTVPSNRGGTVSKTTLTIARRLLYFP
jgi:hypothetical protein